MIGVVQTSLLVEMTNTVWIPLVLIALSTLNPNPAITLAYALAAHSFLETHILKDVKNPVR